MDNELEENILNVHYCPRLEYVVAGKKSEVEAHVRDALQVDLSPHQILEEGPIAAMQEVGDRFERGEFYVPEMLVAARAMQGKKSMIEALEDFGHRRSVKVIVGGAPMTEAHAKQISAAGYAPDACRAVNLAKRFASK
jgi:methanogenic corrinoid protein MtbC1